MADNRHRRCMGRLADVLPWLEPTHLDAAVRSVLGEADDYAAAQATAVLHLTPAPTERPACRHVPVADVVPGDAVWENSDGTFYIVIANPSDPPGGYQVITYSDGVEGEFEPGMSVPVAVSTIQAMEWNQAESALFMGARPLELELLDLQHPDSDAGDRRRDPGAAA